MFAELLIQIPIKQAEKLLEKHWKYLGYSPEFIQPALYIGTQKCLELAASSINECPNDVPVFEFTSSIFGFIDSKREQYLTVQHLNRLLPYLDRLNQSDLRELAEACQRMGIPEWGEQYLLELLDERNRKNYYPFDSDLLLEFDRFAADRHGESLVVLWLEDFDRRRDSKSRALIAVRRWLLLHPTLRSLQIAAACVQAVGARKDLSILDVSAIEESPDEIAKIKANTWFAICRRTLD